jgi:hypothetical protein
MGSRLLERIRRIRAGTLPPGTNCHRPGRHEFPQGAIQRLHAPPAFGGQRLSLAPGSAGGIVGVLPQHDIQAQSAIGDQLAFGHPQRDHCEPHIDGDADLVVAQTSSSGV